MNISSDKNVTVGVISAMDDEMIDALLSMGDSLGGEETTEEKTYTDEDRWEMLDGEDSTLTEPEGFSTKRYDSNGYKGFSSTKSLGNIDKVSASSASARVDVIDGDNYFDGILFIKDGKKYKSNMMVDIEEEATNIDTYKAQGGTFILELTITLPVKPLSNNATKVSSNGKTLTWDLLTSKNIDFEFEFEEEKPISENIEKTPVKEVVEPKKEETSEIIPEDKAEEPIVVDNNNENTNSQEEKVILDNTNNLQKGLSKEAVLGVIAAALVIVLALVTTLVLFLKRKNNK